MCNWSEKKFAVSYNRKRIVCGCLLIPSYLRMHPACQQAIDQVQMIEATMHNKSRFIDAGDAKRVYQTRDWRLFCRLDKTNNSEMTAKKSGHSPRRNVKFRLNTYAHRGRRIRRIFKIRMRKVIILISHFTSNSHKDARFLILLCPT